MGWHPGDLTVTSGGAPLVASPARLASHVFDDQGTQHVFYRTADRRVVELWWRGGEAARWGYLTTSANGAPPAAADPTCHVFAAEGTQHVFYRATDGLIVELWWRGGETAHWGYLTKPGNKPPAAPGNLASHVFAAEGTQHVFYRATDGHIIELWWRSDAAIPEDLTERSGEAPLAAGDPVSHVLDADGSQHVFYASVDNQVIELWWRPGEKPHVENLTMRSVGAPPSGFGDRPTSHVFSADGTQHVFYNSADAHIIELRWPNQTPPWRDLLDGLGEAASSAPTSHVFAAKGIQHVFYSNQELHIMRVGVRGNESPAHQDLTIASGGAPHAIGGPTSHVFAAEGTQHVFYTTVQDHIVELWADE